MFSASSSSKVTPVCVVAMMMMMMMMITAEAAAMSKVGSQPKHSMKTQAKPSDGAMAQMVPLQLDTNILVPTRVIRPLQNSSISPWTYDFSHDDSLFPPRLAEARCLLQGCLDSAGRENISLESRPIMHQVMVLRRVRSTGAGSGAGSKASATMGSSYHYQLEYRLIAVGCTCIRPTVRQQQ